MLGQTMHCAEEEPGGADARGENAEDGSGATRGRPEIVRAPAERLRGVAVREEAKNKPHRESDPGKRMVALQAPDENGDVHGESKGLEKRNAGGGEGSAHVVGV